MSIGKKSLGETITALSLVELIEAPNVVSIEEEHVFYGAGENISLLITEFLLRASVGDLLISKKRRKWAALNAVFLPPFFTEAVIIEG